MLLECFDNYHKTLNKIVFVGLQDPSFVVLGYDSLCSSSTKKVKFEFIIDTNFVHILKQLQIFLNVRGS